MGYVNVSRDDKGNDINLYYEDLGSGSPVVFIHGWPVNNKMWEYQINELSFKGIRCISYDRRGFGKSDKPFDGYDYDTLTDDLKSILDHLNLQDVTLVGFSMGGGEVVRYFSKYGGARVSKVVLLASVAPYLLKTEDNPDGTPVEMFDQIYDKFRDDRPAFLTGFGKQFYGVNLLNHKASEEILEWAHALALEASPIATLKCLRSFSTTDFRKEMSSISVPALIIHGDADKNVPIEISGKKAAELIPGSQYIVYEGAPHGLFYTEKERLNSDLINFVLDNNGIATHTSTMDYVNSSV